MDYNKQSNDFLKVAQATCTIEEVDCSTPRWDDKPHRTFKVTLKRGSNSYTFKFWGNALGDDITAYDVLACVQKYEVGLFEDFIEEFGYTINSTSDFKKVMTTYKAVKKEYDNIYRLFYDVMEELQEIY